MQDAAEGAKLSGNRTVSGQTSGKCKKQTTDEAILPQSVAYGAQGAGRKPRPQGRRIFQVKRQSADLSKFLL